MRILFDTNLVLDLLLDREPFAQAAAVLITRVEAGTIEGFIGATTVTTIHYLTTRALGPARSKRSVATLLDLFRVAPVDASVLRTALDSGFSDDEDAVLHAAAVAVNVDSIVTRNVRDFRRSSVRVYSPEELLALPMD